MGYNREGDGGFMEITWYGLSCFRLTERSLATVVTDPYDSQVVGYESLNRADIVTISPTPGHNFTNAVKGVSHSLLVQVNRDWRSVRHRDPDNSVSKANGDQPRNTCILLIMEGTSPPGDLSRVPRRPRLKP
jgi:hypothetical protein